MNRRTEDHAATIHPPPLPHAFRSGFHALLTAHSVRMNASTSPLAVFVGLLPNRGMLPVIILEPGGPPTDENRRQWDGDLGARC